MYRFVLHTPATRKHHLYYPRKYVSFTIAIYRSVLTCLFKTFSLCLFQMSFVTLQFLFNVLFSLVYIFYFIPLEHTIKALYFAIFTHLKLYWLFQPFKHYRFVLENSATRKLHLYNSPRLVLNCLLKIFLSLHFKWVSLLYNFFLPLLIYSFNSWKHYALYSEYRQQHIHI